METETDNGFLAEPLDHIRAAVRKKYSELRKLLLVVNNIAVSNQHSIEIHLDSDIERCASVLFARTLTTTEASILLLEIGLISQALVLLRAALETLFALAAIAKEPGIVEKLIEGHVAEQKRAARNVKLGTNPELKQIVETEVKSGELDKILESSANALSAFDLAQKAGLEDWYRTVYMVFSWPTHGALTDLDRHVVMDDDGNVAEFRNEPEINGQESSWLCAIEIILKATIALAAIFPSVDRSSLDKQYEEACRLAKELEG